MSQPTDDAAILDLIARWTEAICRGDLEGVTADRVEDIVMFDVPEPIQERGIEAYRRTWGLFFAHTAAGPARFRVEEVNIESSDQVAFAHGLLRIGGDQAHCRLTLGLRKKNGRWWVTHEHHSMPAQLG